MRDLKEDTAAVVVSPGTDADAVSGDVQLHLAESPPLSANLKAAIFGCPSNQGNESLGYCNQRLLRSSTERREKRASKGQMSRRTS